MNMPYGFPGMPMVQPPFGVYNKLPMAPPLYIGDLDENIHEETLHDFFSKFGPLHFVRIMRDPATGKSRGFGYVNFLYPRDAESARQYAQYEKLGRKHIRIMFKRNVRDLPPEANLFVKNLDPSVTVKDLHNHFTQNGINVLSAKVATNSEGHSLGYGYVQFEKKEDAENCLGLLQGSRLKENDLQLFPFVSKEKRPGTVAKRNIYAKNLPLNKSEEEINKIVSSVFSKYGHVETLFIKKSNDNKYSAFVCFANEDDAHRAFNELTADPETLPGAEGPLYVSWHQGRAERNRELSKQYQQTQNETNLYVKNLRLDVTEQELKAAFEQFGIITSVACKEWVSHDSQKKARFGFIAFQDPNDAQRAVHDAFKDAEIRNLYLPEVKPYINLHQSKPKRNEFLYSQKKLKAQVNMGGIAPGMPGMGAMPGMPGMGGMGGPGFGGVNPMASMPNRKFPPIAGMMNPGFKGGQGGFRQPPRTHKAGWGKGPNQGRPFLGQQRAGPGGPGGIPGGPGAGAGAGPRQQQQQQQQQIRPPVAQNKKLEMNLKPQVAPSQTVSGGMTVQNLKTKLNDFLQLDIDKQRQILGELLFPLVKNISGENLAPKITGMLIDLSVLEVTEILEFLENPSLLEERVTEAVELIETEGI